MKTKLLTIGLAVALCGVAGAAEKPVEKITTKIDKNYLPSFVAIRSYDQNDVHTGYAYVNPRKCNFTAKPSVFTARVSDEKTQKQILLSLTKEALRYQYENGCAGAYFQACEDVRNHCKEAGAATSDEGVIISPTKLTGKVKALFGHNPF